MKKKTDATPTHNLVIIPNPEGTYRDPGGSRVNILKVPNDKIVTTTKQVFQGTTIARFIKDHGYSKA